MEYMCVSAAQDHMKSLQAIVGITRLDSFHQHTNPNAVANRTRRCHLGPLTESNERGTHSWDRSIDRGQSDNFPRQRRITTLHVEEELSIGGSP